MLKKTHVMTSSQLLITLGLNYHECYRPFILFHNYVSLLVIPFCKVRREEKMDCFSAKSMKMGRTFWGVGWGVGCYKKN